MPNFFSDACVLRRTDETLPVIAVSAAYLAVPPTRARNMFKAMTKLRDLGVSRIINVCSESPALERHIEMYKMLGITHHHIPIEDDSEIPVPRDFFPQVLEAYRQHDPATGIILIHCFAGVNRSMLAAALLLWTTTPNAADVWMQRGHSLIEFMDHEQTMQRGGFGILTNPTFRNYLHVFCLESECK